MKILITGATGLIGTTLVESLSAEHRLVIITRDAQKAKNRFGNKPEFIECDLNSKFLQERDFAGVEAIINLAGESIQGRWTEQKKSKILQSRKNISRNLLANCPASVKVIITASAQGIYGDRGDEELTESSAAGQGFLAEVCKAWEADYKKMTNQRVVILRLGIVLSKRGGALAKLVGLFSKNLGAVLGSGKQWMSYISLHDLERVISQALTDARYEGVINAVNDAPVTNREFTVTLCKKMKVFKLPPVPEFMLKMLMGEMSEIVLSSLKLRPQKLLKLGFNFDDGSLESALNREL